MSVKTTAEGKVLIRWREALGSHRVSICSEKSGTSEGNGGTHKDGGGTGNTGDTGERVGVVIAQHALHGTKHEGHYSFFRFLFRVGNIHHLEAHVVVNLFGMAFFLLGFHLIKHGIILLSRFKITSQLGIKLGLNISIHSTLGSNHFLDHFGMGYGISNSHSGNGSDGNEFEHSVLLFK